MDGEWLIVGTVVAVAVAGVTRSFGFRMARFFGRPGSARANGGEGDCGGCDGCAGCAGRDGCGSDNYLSYASRTRYPASTDLRNSSVAATSFANDSTLASGQHARRIHLPVLGPSAGSRRGQHGANHE